MTGFPEDHRFGYEPDGPQRFSELMDEVSLAFGVAQTSFSSLSMQIEQVMSRGLYGRVSTRDLPPVDHRMLGRAPLFPERPVMTSTVVKASSEVKWTPPPLTSADLYADWQYRCAQHAKQRY